MSTDPTPDGVAGTPTDAMKHLVKRAVRPIDIEHDQLMARAEVEHQARVTADQARAATDQAAALLEGAEAIDRLRATLAPSVAHRYASGLGLAATELRRLAAGERDEQQAQQGASLIDDYLRFLRGQGPEPDLSELSPADREVIAGQFEIVRALADRDPSLPPLDLDPVARRLGLHADAPADEEQQAETQAEEVALLRLTVDAVEEGRRELRSENARLRAQLWTLAAALDGLHTLIATSSRDWGQYRVDAWLWAVLCGWDCEQAEHDETCTHGALEETAALHSWDDDTVAKARRYRAAVRVLTEPAAPATGQPPADTSEEAPCTCAAAGDCFAPCGRYADCPQATPPAVVAEPGKEDGHG